MHILNFSADHGVPIAEFSSSRASSVDLAHGQGEVHVYAVHFDANGIIGNHPTGFCQLFLVTQGDGWVAGEDGIRQQLSAGYGAVFKQGESHSKGSESGMAAIMVQVAHLED